MGNYLARCFILIQAVFLINCARPFETADLSSTGKVGNIGTLPTNVSTIDGSLGWKTISQPNANDLEFQFQMKIPYKRIYQLTSTLIRSMVPYTCHFVPGILKSSPSDYGSGEIPCGQIADANWKQLLLIKMDPIRESSGGFKYSVSGMNFPIWITRRQKTGVYSEASLDSKSTVAMTTSPNFGEDISFRYSPTGDQARLEMCVNVPGGIITSSPQRIEAKASKQILGVKVSYGTMLDLEPGQATFDYGRGCFAVNFGWTGNNLAPQLDLSSTQAPYLSNASYAGLRIKLTDWFLKLIDGIMDLFRASFRKKAEAQGIRTANKMLDQDVETGRWFTKMHGEDLIETTGRNFTSQLSKSFRRIGIPATSDDLRSMIKDSCRLKRLGLSQDWTQRLETFCRDVIAKIEIDIDPFAVEQNSSSKGCYSYFARIHDSKGKWWSNECKFASNFKIKIPGAYKDFETELKQVLASRFSLDRIPKEWRNYVQSLGVDEWTLALVLEELEKIGYNQVNASDWQNRLEGIITQIRNRQIQIQL